MRSLNSQTIGGVFIVGIMGADKEVLFHACASYISREDVAMCFAMPRDTLELGIQPFPVVSFVLFESICLLYLWRLVRSNNP